MVESYRNSEGKVRQRIILSLGDWSDFYPFAFIPALAEETIFGIFEWLAANILLLIGGQFMEPSGLLIIVAPLVFPIATTLGIDPIHLGIIMVVNMEIGMITPPVGLNLFVTASVSGMRVSEVVRAALPWLAVLVVVLLLITYIPAISLLPPVLVGWPDATS